MKRDEWNSNHFHVRYGITWKLLSTYRGVAIRGGGGGRQGEQGAIAPHFNFWTKQVPTVSVSDTRDIAFYGFYNWKGPILNAGPSENFVIADHPKEDHNEREFKRLIIGGILDQLEKSSKTREASYKWSRVKYNSIKTWPSQNILWNKSSIQMWSTSKN